MVGASWAVVAVGGESISLAAGLYALDQPEFPFLVLQHAGLLYVLVPAVALASIVLWFVPGFFLVIAFGQSERWTGVLIRAFGVSFAGYVILTSSIKLLWKGAPPPHAIAIAMGVAGALALSILSYRSYRHGNVSWPSSDDRRVLWAIAIPVILLLVLLPLFLWQDMHDDGFEALELGRSLSEHLLPRFPNRNGLLGLGIGMIPMAFPVHWFVTLFGPLEVSARLPMLLYLPVLFALLVELIEWKSPRALRWKEEAVLVLGLAIYAVTMSFNASYDPYFADIAAPAALETMTIICMLGAIYFLWRERTLWFLFFAVLSYLCRPTGLMMLGLLGLGVALFMPERRKRMLGMIAAAAGLILLLSFFYDTIYAPWVTGTSDLGYRSSSIIERVRYLRLIEPFRLNFGLFPSGILPFLVLPLFGWQDQYARVLAAVSLAYFSFFFFAAFVALHHFVPIMILPMIVFWRVYLRQSAQFKRIALPAMATISLIAIFLSMPQHFELNRTVRAIGQKTQIRIGTYEDDYKELLQHELLFYKLIPPDWEVTDASSELVSSFTSLVYYATRPKLPTAEINYIVQGLHDPAPAGFQLVAADTTAGLYVRDQEEWERDRFQELRTEYKSPLYEIPPTTLFYYRGFPEDQILIDLRRVAGDAKRFMLGVISSDSG